MQLEELIQRLVHLEIELLETEKEIFELKDERRKTIEKDLANAILAEEMIKVETQKSNSSSLNVSSKEAIRHRICMMCLRNEVTVVFLPCTHLFLCAPCYSENFKTEGGCCPYCHVKIERSIKAVTPTEVKKQKLMCEVKKQKLMPEVKKQKLM